MRDASGQALAYVYCEDEPGGALQPPSYSTKDEAQRIAAHIAKLPDLLRK